MTFRKLTSQKILCRAIYFRKSFWCNAFGNRSLSFLLVRYLAPRSLFLGTPIFPSPKKPKLSATFQLDQNGKRRTPAWVCYL